MQVIYRHAFRQHYHYCWNIDLNTDNLPVVGSLSFLFKAYLIYYFLFIDVNKTIYYKTANDYSCTEPKTRAGIRKVALDDYTISILEEWRGIQAAHIKTDFALSYNGKPVNKHTLSQAVKRFVKLANVPVIRVHALRHSHVALLISLGENPLSIKERVGHENIQITLGTYGHLYPHTHSEIANKLNGSVNVSTSEQNKVAVISNQFISR